MICRTVRRSIFLLAPVASALACASGHGDSREISQHLDSGRLADAAESWPDSGTTPGTADGSPGAGGQGGASDAAAGSGGRGESDAAAGSGGQGGASDASPSAGGSPPTGPHDAAMVCPYTAGDGILYPILEINGTYVDDSGVQHDIDGDWTVTTDELTSVFHWHHYSNNDNLMTALNDGSNAIAPCRFSLFEWIWVSDHDGGAEPWEPGERPDSAVPPEQGWTLYVCHSYYKGQGPGEPLQHRADRMDLVAGCGGGPWSALRPI